MEHRQCGRGRLFGLFSACLVRCTFKSDAGRCSVLSPVYVMVLFLVSLVSLNNRRSIVLSSRLKLSGRVLTSYTYIHCEHTTIRQHLYAAVNLSSVSGHFHHHSWVAAGCFVWVGSSWAINASWRLTAVVSTLWFRSNNAWTNEPIRRYGIHLKSMIMEIRLPFSSSTGCIVTRHHGALPAFDD